MVYFVRHRKRETYQNWYAQTKTYGTLISADEYKISYGQETWDEPHSWRAFQDAKKRHPKLFSRLDMGGPFSTRKFSYEGNTPVFHLKQGPYEYIGPQFAGTANADWKTSPWWGRPVTDDALYETHLMSSGSTAISRCAPTNPHAAALTAMTELYRDGLPAAIGLNALRRRDLGGEYLNYEFGILPTWSDLRSLHNAYKNADKYLKQYYRDSNKVVRRTYRFPPTVEVLSDETVDIVPMPALNSTFYSSTNGKRRTIKKLEKSTWFSGAFTYHAEMPSSVLAVRDQIQKYDYLYGTNPSLSTFWELLPYSWAADWITNIGDVLNNVAMYQNDGLVMVYGYVMETTRHITEVTNTGAALVGAGPIVCSQTFTTESKERRKATPFGFGVELGSFTDRQWAILAALGMSRGRGALAY